MFSCGSRLSAAERRALEIENALKRTGGVKGTRALLAELRSLAGSEYGSSPPGVYFFLDGLDSTIINSYTDPGVYNLSNSQTSTFRIVGNYIVSVYSGRDADINTLLYKYTGPGEWQYPLPSGNDNIVSAKIEATSPRGVYFFLDGLDSEPINFYTDPGVYNLSISQTSALRIVGNYVATVYGGRNADPSTLLYRYTGPGQWQYPLPSGNDNIFSTKIEASSPPGVYFFLDGLDSEPVNFYTDPGVYNLRNSQTSTLRIVGNYTASVYGRRDAEASTLLYTYVGPGEWQYPLPSGNDNIFSTKISISGASSSRSPLGVTFFLDNLDSAIINSYTDPGVYNLTHNQTSALRVVGTCTVSVYSGRDADPNTLLYKYTGPGEWAYPLPSGNDNIVSAKIEVADGSAIDAQYGQCINSVCRAAHAWETQAANAVGLAQQAVGDAQTNLDVAKARLAAANAELQLARGEIAQYHC